MGFTRQPQYPARIDRGNPLSRGLVFAFNAATPTIEAVSGKSNAGDGSSGVSVGGGTFGKRLSGNAGTAGNYRYWTGLTTTAEYTALAVVLDSVGRGTTRNPFDSDDSNGGTRVFQLRFNASDQAEFIPFNTGGTPFFPGASSASSSATGLSVIAATVDASKVARVYLNAVSGSTDTITGTPATLSTSDRLAVGGVNNPTASGAPFKGDVYATFFWNRALSAAEITRFCTNPWQLFRSPSSGLYGTPNAAGSSGTLAYTNANDSLVASGTTTITGTLAKTNANDTLTASGAVGANITGTVAVTNANDSLAAAGTTTITGSLAKINANDSAVASGTTAIVGLLAKTNANDTLVASGIAGAITGTVSYTNANDSASASGVGNPNAQASGGFFEVPHVKRRTTVQEERERLGIIPKKIKRVIEAVAQQSVSQEKTDIQAQLLLAEKLAKQDIEAKARYAEFMRQERDRILARDIKLALLIRTKQQADDEDDEYAVEMLLL